VYIEDYGQLDVNVSYQVNENLSLHAEAINLTDETARSHGRDARQVFFATQTGPRYTLCVRYRIGASAHRRSGNPPTAAPPVSPRRRPAPAPGGRRRALQWPAAAASRSRSMPWRRRIAGVRAA